jgi:hypothetical protein
MKPDTRLVIPRVGLPSFPFSVARDGPADTTTRVPDGEKDDTTASTTGVTTRPSAGSARHKLVVRYVDEKEGSAEGRDESGEAALANLAPRPEDNDSCEDDKLAY